DEDHSRLSDIDVIQPMLFAIEVALAALWRSWGIEPDMVVGHSMGEVAAAYVAGALRSEEHTSELQSPCNIVCRLPLEKKTSSTRCTAVDPKMRQICTKNKSLKRRPKSRAVSLVSKNHCQKDRCSASTLISSSSTIWQS